jgi:hypothetical protein
MRETRSSGSVRGASGDGRPYRERSAGILGLQPEGLRCAVSGHFLRPFDRPNAIGPAAAMTDRQSPFYDGVGWLRYRISTLRSWYRICGGAKFRSGGKRHASRAASNCAGDRRPAAQPVIPASTAGPLAGSVVGLAGQVFVDRSGQRYALRLGEQVYVDDTLEVSGGAKLKLRMGGGSIVSLAPETSLRIDVYALDAYGRRQSAVLSLGQGLARSLTVPGDQPADFAVGTSGARSTDWLVEAAPGYYPPIPIPGGGDRGRPGGPLR